MPDNNKSTKVDITTPNKTPAKSDLKTLPEFYSFYYHLILNKLPKDEADAVRADSNKPTRIIRGQIMEYSHVRNFVRDVCERAEEAYDRFLAKPKPVVPATPAPIPAP